MATRCRVASSPPRKRRSSDKDRQDFKKKRKDSSSSRKQKSKHSKSSKKSPSSGLKVRTVTELAALVASGAVRVPQGLEHYVSDRRQLLDQVFTILGLEDVSGMLPDVLKGLKMKRVKALCLAKLQSMREQDIISVIQTTDSPPAVDLNETIMQLLGQAPPGSQTVGNEVGTGDNTEPQKMDIEITVSDVSDDEQATKNKDINNKSEEIEDPMGKNTVTNIASEAAPISKTISPPFNNTSEPSPTKHSKEDGAISDSEAEDITEDVNQLLEMELRQRALESALKKATHSDRDCATEGDSVEPEQEMQCQEEDPVENTVFQEVVMRSEGSSSGYSAKVIGDMVEQKLREKLLQSLAANRQK